VSITIRAVGQAGRRGATRRIPNAAALLAAVDEWLVDTTADMLRGHVPGTRTADGALEVCVHPAARPIRFDATEAGGLTAEAMTAPVGPGYHTFVANLLHRLGEELEVTWSGPPSDDLASASASIGDGGDELEPGGGAGRGSRRSPVGVLTRATAFPGAVVSKATALPGAMASRAAALPGAVVSKAAGSPEEDLEPSTDPTGAFFSRTRADAERGHLAWLRSGLLAVRDARRRGAVGIHLGTPPGVRFTFDGAFASVLGPRDDAWLERALADPRVAADIWPWVPDAMDARYHLNRALTQMWTEVRWRPPVGDGEAAVLDDLLASLRFAYPLEPELPWPWMEWREAFVNRGQTDPATFQLLQRATLPRGPRTPMPTPGSVLIGGSSNGTPGAPVAADATSATAPIGYRRGPVTILHEGWAVDLPGSFTEQRTLEEWSGSDAGRSVTLAATPTGIGEGPMPPETFLRQVAGHLGRDAIEHEAGPVRGRARLSSDISTGVEVATVEGYSAVRGSGAAIRIVIEDPQDWKWALDTWRSLRPA
jgi:hypothetical protein